MAIEPTVAEVIRQFRPTLPNDRVLCLGFPDILTTEAPPNDAERKQIAAWHHWPHGIEDAGHFFGKQELDAEYWDITRARGPEIEIDLNEIIQPNSYDGDMGLTGYEASCEAKFGLVIDPGTLEHIANIGNCWRTICAVTALNGRVIHANPITMANHGFYSIHPTAYVDIYEANGFEVDLMLELSGPLAKRTIREAPRFNRYEPAANAVMLVSARKVKDVPFTWPTQTKYRRNPDLKRAAE